MGKFAVLCSLAMTRLPEPVVRLLYTGRRERRGDLVMDPKAQAAGRFSLTVRVPGQIPTIAQSRKQIRALVGAFDEPAPALARKVDQTIPGPNGDIPVRIYSDHPKSGQSQPILVYFHGGGWVQGDLDTHDGICGKLAKWGNCLVLAVDYRLAPEHKFPAGLQDAEAAYFWARQQGAEIGGDPTRVGIAGDSAGGNFSAALSHMAAAAGTPPNLQVLIYPALDAAMDTASLKDLEHAYILPRERIDFYLDQYASSPDDYKDPRFSPALHDDLSQQPPTFIVTCGFDPLCDEGAAYHDRLKKAGIDSTHLFYPGQIHAFINLCKIIPQSNHCIKEIADWLRHKW